VEGVLNKTTGEAHLGKPFLTKLFQTF